MVHWWYKTAQVFENKALFETCYQCCWTTIHKCEKVMAAVCILSWTYVSPGLYDWYVYYLWQMWVQACMTGMCIISDRCESWPVWLACVLSLTNVSPGLYNWHEYYYPWQMWVQAYMTCMCESRGCVILVHTMIILKFKVQAKTGLR